MLPMRNFGAEQLEAFTADAFTSHGMPPEDAAIAARTLLFSNLRGLDTHGVARIPGYLKRFDLSLVNPTPRMRVESRFGWSATLDGDNGMGPVVGQRAMDEALARADAHGIGMTTARHSNHFGAASYFALQAVSRDCIGIVMSPASKSLAPFGSMEPLLGTNPIAAAAPAGRHAPWVMDMATSISARGHIRLAARHGRSIPEGWALDGQGRPTTDAHAALEGVMLPLAGAKGSALSMMVEILGGVLSGSAFGGGIRDMNLDFEKPQDVGHFFLAFKVEAFMPVATFNDRMETMIARIRTLRPASGFVEVLYPGEPEARVEAKRRVTGIPLSPEVVEPLQAVADQFGIRFPEPLTSSDAAAPALS